MRLNKKQLLQLENSERTQKLCRVYDNLHKRNPAKAKKWYDCWFGKYASQAEQLLRRA